MGIIELKSQDVLKALRTHQDYGGHHYSMLGQLQSELYYITAIEPELIEIQNALEKLSMWVEVWVEDNETRHYQFTYQWDELPEKEKDKLTTIN